MRIAIDLTALDDNRSGIERYAMCMTKAMIRADRSNTYELIFKNRIFGDLSEEAGMENVNVHILPGCGKLRFIQLRLLKYLKRLPADRYVFFAYPQPVLFRADNIYATIHDMACGDCPETMKRKMVWYYRLSYRAMAMYAKRILTVSEFSKKRITDILKVEPEMVKVIYNGLTDKFTDVKPPSEEDIMRIRKKYSLPEKYLLCLSTLEPKKNMQLLVGAYGRYVRTDKNALPLVIAGRNGWLMDDLMHRADKDAQKAVTLTGFIDEEDLTCLYCMADGFIFPSKYEGFGIPPIEAMACGIPVISSDAEAMKEILADACLYFKNDDEDSLIDTLIRFTSMDGDEKRAYIEKGYERIKLYSYDTEAQKLLRILESGE